jgi:frataxin-like iron-binding protein CyaY
MSGIIRRRIARSILQPRQLDCLTVLDVQFREINNGAAFVGEGGRRMMVEKKNYYESKNCYHSSAQTLLAVRRRRRGAKQIIAKSVAEKLSTSDDDDENDETSTLQRLHNPISNSKEFYQAASELLDKLEVALEPMKSINDFFITERSKGDLGEIYKIDLGPTKGLYTIEISETEHVFEYGSPVSGTYIYCKSSITGQWINISDGHHFEGMLVRDLIRSDCLGLPKL